MSNKTNILELIRNNELNEIKLYLEYNTFDYDNLNYSFIAIYSQQKISYEIIEYFINEMKFNINYSILSYAIKYKQIDVITFLLEKSNFVFSDAILKDAVKSNDSNILKLFIYNDEFNNHMEIQYPLLTAVQYNCINSLYTLLEANKYNPAFNNNTLIHRALLNKNLEAIKLLLKEEQVKKLLINEQKELYGKINILLSQQKIKHF